MHWEDVAGIDARLARLNCKVCLLTIDATALKKRIITDRTVEWHTYLKRFGTTNREIIDHYTKQQQALKSLCDKTALATLVIDTTTAAKESILDKVIDFWGALS
jgi:hypothetical protein